MDERESVDAFITCTKVSATLPSPNSFELYTPTSKNYPSYTPEIQKQFEFKEFLVAAESLPIRAVAPKGKKDKRRKSKRAVGLFHLNPLRQSFAYQFILESNWK